MQLDELSLTSRGQGVGYQPGERGRWALPAASQGRRLSEKDLLRFCLWILSGVQT